MILLFGTLVGLDTLWTIKNNWWLGQSQILERPEALAGLIDEIYLLYETSLSTPGEVIVLSSTTDIP